MTDGALVLALSAGMLAAVNPCGFALLPAYLTLLVVGDQPSTRWAAVRRAVLLTVAMTTGFVAVFGVAGLVIAAAAGGLQRHLPWVTVMAGLALVAAGWWLLIGRSLPVLGWSPAGVRISRAFPSMVLFGVTYAVASLTCTIAPFLAIVVASFRSGAAAEGALLFVAYGVGMGLVVGAAAVAVATAQSSLISVVRRSGRWVQPVAGALLVVVGGYVAYYGWWEIRILGGAAARDPVIDVALRLQSLLTQAVSRVGPVPLMILAVVLVAGVVLAHRLGRRRRLGTTSRV